MLTLTLNPSTLKHCEQGRPRSRLGYVLLAALAAVLLAPFYAGMWLYSTHATCALLHVSAGELSEPGFPGTTPSTLACGSTTRTRRAPSCMRLLGSWASLGFRVCTLP